MRPRKLCLLMGAWLLASPAGAATPDGVDFFEQKIRPVLAEQCYSCHSARAGKVRGKLLLDTRQGLLKGGASGPSLVPGKPAQSLLLEVLRYDGDVRMPPKAKLPDAVIQDFTRWIEKGAPDPRDGTEAPSGGIDWKTARRFWSFQPLHNPAIPAVKDASWPRTPIDHFILARLESEHLTPAAAADRRTLLRRATFDLVGLPPTTEEIAAFEADTSTDAFARVVDRLLASPHYGERWGRYWLDVARYAEDQAHTFGVKPYTSAWRYRDWVIAALNADMPYDRFVKLQIAADLMEGSPDGMASQAALGFFGLGAQYYDNKDPKAAADELDDRVDTLARGFLGLTVSCARCHDHKFDPIPQEDYYSLAGVFKSCRMSEVFLASGPQVERYQAAQKRLQAAEKALRELVSGKQKNLPQAERKQRMAKMRAECERCKKEMPPAPPMAHGLAEATPSDMRVYLRGDPLQPGDVAPRRFPRILAGERRSHFSQGSGRLQLAEAIASKDNPLTARVLVNRVWQHHFGRGIVGTPSNFGQLGERPTHPELLDYLAGRLIASGWSLKQLHRDIMLSAVYQLSSRADQPAAAVQADPDNRLLWRGSRRRLDVEAYRDALLAVSGRLDRSFGGPTLHLDSPDNRRRTVYGKISRHELSGLLRLFDFPDANITSDRRTETTVPQQQLFVLNSPFFIAQAKALADRAAGLPDDNARIERVYRLAFGRAPTPAELRLGLAYLGGKDAAGEQGRNQLTRWQRYAQVVLGSNEFLYLD